MPIEIVLDVREKGWKKAVRTYRKSTTDACEAAYLSKKKKELAVVLADDAFVKELNRTYRGKDTATNVLSFVGDGEALGDIVLALETVQKEALAHRKTVRAHLMHLLVHGMLHLQGFDHETRSEAEMMEVKEIKILKKLGLANPYLYDKSP